MEFGLLLRAATQGLILSWMGLTGVQAKTSWYAIELANEPQSVIRAYVAEPDNYTGRLPTILVLHGGQGLIGEHLRVADQFAAKGFVAVAICVWDPRTSASPPPPNARIEIIQCDDAPKLRKPPLPDVYRSKTLGTLRDTRKFLLGHSGVDPDKFYVWGQSTGAALALMWIAKGGSTVVKGVIACSPPTHFDESPRPGFDKYIPKVQPNGKSIEFLPISVAPDIKTPLFLMHGKRDDVVSIDESERFSKILKENGVKVQTLFEDHAGHHDCWKNPARYIETWTQWIHAL